MRMCGSEFAGRLERNPSEAALINHRQAPACPRRTQTGGSERCAEFQVRRWLTSAASPGLRSRFGAISVRFASGALFLVQLQANSPRHKRILPENSEVKRKITNELLIRPEGTACNAFKRSWRLEAQRPSDRGERSPGQRGCKEGGFGTASQRVWIGRL